MEKLTSNKSLEILTFNSFVKSINKKVNYDLKNLSSWLKADKNIPKCWKDCYFRLNGKNMKQIIFKNLK